MMVSNKSCEVGVCPPNMFTCSRSNNGTAAARQTHTCYFMQDDQDDKKDANDSHEDDHNKHQDDDIDMRSMMTN